MLVATLCADQCWQVSDRFQQFESMSVLVALGVVSTSQQAVLKLRHDGSISGSDLAMWQFMYVMAISTIYIETGVTHHRLLLTGLKVACVTVSRWKYHRHQQFSGDAERQEMKRQHGRLSSTQQLSFS